MAAIIGAKKDPAPKRLRRGRTADENTDWLFKRRAKKDANRAMAEAARALNALAGKAAEVTTKVEALIVRLSAPTTPPVVVRSPAERRERLLGRWGEIRMRLAWIKGSGDSYRRALGFEEQKEVDAILGMTLPPDSATLQKLLFRAEFLFNTMDSDRNVFRR